MTECNSLNLSKTLNVRHGHACKMLRKLKEEGVINYTITKYKNSRGRYYDLYELKKNDFENLKIRNKFNFVSCKRLENIFYEILKKFLNFKIEREYVIGKYRIDFIIKSERLLIEYYEDGHKFVKDKDEKRIKNIIKFSNEYMDDNYIKSGYDIEEGYDYFDLVIVKQGKEIEGLREIIDVLEKNGESVGDIEYFKSESFVPDKITL